MQPDEYQAQIERKERNSVEGREGVFASRLDRKWGTLTLDSGPLCGCESLCVFILLDMP